jgi:putative heme-binding domain-containing protein
MTQDLPENTRIVALKVGAMQPDATSPSAWLCGFLSRSEPQALQEAALSALERRNAPSTADEVLKSWKLYSPATRAALIPVLLVREPWIIRFLEGIDAGTVSVAEVAPADRQRLLGHSNPELRQRAGKVFGAIASTDRQAVVARYSRLDSSRGDAMRGAAAFKANCATCHALHGEGHAVGPDLTPFRTKPIEDFVVAVLDPSRAIEPRFLAYEVETKDGRVLGGVLKNETAAGFTLVQASGKEEALLRRDVEGWRASSVSLMPEGMETALPEAVMLDLYAFVVRPPAVGH